MYSTAEVSVLYAVYTRALRSTSHIQFQVVYRWFSLGVWIGYGCLGVKPLVPKRRYWVPKRVYRKYIPSYIEPINSIKMSCSTLFTNSYLKNLISKKFFSIKFFCYILFTSVEKFLRKHELVKKYIFSWTHKSFQVKFMQQLDIV